MEIIYCDTQNQRAATIAVETGLIYGAQLPARQVFYQPFFTDQDWKKPDKAKYVKAVEQHKPTIATVLDWEREDQLSEVLEWAESVAPFVQHVVLIPKVHGGITRLPKQIGGKQVVLGFSVPTSFGGTTVPVSEFCGWPFHLLGGSPKAQFETYRQLTHAGAELFSADGNMISKMCIRYRRWWNGKEWALMPDQDPRAYDDEQFDNRYHYFRLSCENIITGWHDTIKQPTRKVFAPMTDVLNQHISGQFAAYHGDSVELNKDIPDNSIDYRIFSPPFASLYTYSNSERDLGNCRDYDEFTKQYLFLIKEQFRTMKPGRLLSFHCMNLPTSKQYHGVIGLHDFRGDLIRMYQDAGFIYHSEVVIWKDPVTAMQRTKALGLLYKQIKKDSAMSRQGVPDYLVTMRKPGVNPDPVTKDPEQFPVDLWQRYASPVWFDINPSKTLQYTSAREHDDERHICPLQLEVIERAITLWTNPGDVVASDFMGIGSEGHEALRLGRRFIGFELKESYYKQAVRNLQNAEAAIEAPSLLDLLEPELELASF